MYEGLDRGTYRNPRGIQKPSRFKLLLWLFVFFAVLIFMFAVLSQPLGIIGGVLDDAYPEGTDYAEGRETNTNIQAMIGLALGAAVITGIIFLFVFYTMKNMGGDKDSFG